MLNDLIYGNGVLAAMPVWVYIVITLLLTHLTITCVTLFLHRSQAHRAVTFHPLVTHCMRFWLWLTTGMITRQWVAVHRKHHAKVETHDDPHSPCVKGIFHVLLKGTELYRQETMDKESMRLYGTGTPNDWIEQRLYSKHSMLGVILVLIIQYILFGFVGVSIWAVQMLWIPLFAAGIINGAAHYWGYRNFDTPDNSTNISSIGLIIGGEELHNNHHAYPGAAKFSTKAWELDVGWLYIKALQALRLAQIKRVPSLPLSQQPETPLMAHSKDAKKLGLLLLNSRLHIMAEYMHHVMHPTFRTEIINAHSESYRSLLKYVRKNLFRHKKHTTPYDEEKHCMKLAEVLRTNDKLAIVCEYKNRLQAICKQHHCDYENLHQALLDWCHQAEKTGLDALQSFVQKIKDCGLVALPVTARVQ